MRKKVDLRVKLTRQLLKNSLIDLLEDKDIANITVTELCEGAGINRTTFYAHHTTVKGIFLEIENDVLIDFEKIFSNLPKGFDLEVIITNLLKFFIDHARVLNLVLNKKQSFDLMKQLYRYSADKFKKYVIDNMASNKTESMTYLFYGLAYGVIGIISKWYQNDMQDAVSIIESALTRVMFGILSTIIDFKDII